MMNQKFRNKYVVVQESTTKADTMPIFTATQNKGGFVVLLFGVVKKNTFAKKNIFTFWGSYLRSRREMCGLQCRTGASS
jgi:hypothetical protein